MASTQPTAPKRKRGKRRSTQPGGPPRAFKPKAFIDKVRPGPR